MEVSRRVEALAADMDERFKTRHQIAGDVHNEALTIAVDLIVDATHAL